MTFEPKDIKGLGTVLGVWAHPDDETWAAGGLLAAAAKNGQRVVCVTATRGEAGQTADESRWPQADLAKIRTSELEQALQLLGITEHYFLDFADGKLPDVPLDSGAQAIVELINKVKPDTIVTFGLDGLTGHTDHIAVRQWAEQAIKQTDSQAKLLEFIESKEVHDATPKALYDKIYFNVSNPVIVEPANADLNFWLPSETRRLKLQALKAQPCQMATFFNDPAGPDYLNQRTISESFNYAKL